MSLDAEPRLDLREMGVVLSEKLCEKPVVVEGYNQSLLVLLGLRSLCRSHSGGR